MKENSGVRFPNKSDQAGAERKIAGHCGTERRSTSAHSTREDTAERLARQIAEIPDVRADLVDRIRTQIQTGNYETTRKLDLAVSKMIEEFVEESEA